MYASNVVKTLGSIVRSGVTNVINVAWGLKGIHSARVSLHVNGKIHMKDSGYLIVSAFAILENIVWQPSLTTLGGTAGYAASIFVKSANPVTATLSGVGIGIVGDVISHISGGQEEDNSYNHIIVKNLNNSIKYFTKNLQDIIGPWFDACGALVPILGGEACGFPEKWLGPRYAKFDNKVEAAKDNTEEALKDIFGTGDVDDAAQDQIELKTYQLMNYMLDQGRPSCEKIPGCDIDIWDHAMKSFSNNAQIRIGQDIEIDDTLKDVLPNDHSEL